MKKSTTKLFVGLDVHKDSIAGVLSVQVSGFRDG